MAERFGALIRLHAAREDDLRRRIGTLENQRSTLLAGIAGLEVERSAAAQWSAPALREQAVRYWALITSRITDAGLVLARCEREIDGLRGELAEAHRQRATFEKLAERDARVAARRALRAEARELDEFAAVRRIIAAGARS
jgi:flagellar export protein FliJ